MDNIQTIGKTTQELLGYLKIAAKVAVSENTDETENPYYMVEISGDELGALIGYHGETLNHFQHILSLAINNKLPVRIKILVDIDGWRAQRRESIEAMATQAIQKVKSTGTAQVLPPMSAYERRIIHSLISQETDVTSHSEGEDASRKVIIELKKEE
jgi:spoIIIJ-associated protein